MEEKLFELAITLTTLQWQTLAGICLITCPYTLDEKIKLLYRIHCLCENDDKEVRRVTHYRNAFGNIFENQGGQERCVY